MRPTVGSGTVVTATAFAPSRATTTLPSGNAASIWTIWSPRSTAPAALSRNLCAARAIAGARWSPTVAATTPPDSSKMTASCTCAEICLSSASACAGSTTSRYPILRPREGRLLEVLRRPGDAPGGDDRVLRAPLVRPARLPRALAARDRRAAQRDELRGEGAFQGLSERLDRRDRQDREPDPHPLDRAGHRRRRLPRLELPLAVQRARVGVQHRLRPAEPLVPAREGSRRRRPHRPARRAFHRPADRLDRL